MKTSLLTRPGLMALVWATSAFAAHAQTPPETGADKAKDDVAEVVVTGIKRSNLKAINSKLGYRGVSDVVSANEVQALPDLTIVEALRRVPGLAALPTTDNEHPRDEAATPVIRGLGAAYNNVTVDGMPLASPGTPNANLGSNGRGVRLDLLPSSMISEMRVIKTFGADLDPNAIGGAVDLRTRSAFERGGKPFLTAEASLGGANDVGKPNDQERIGVRLVSTGSLTFGSAKQFGVVVSANYQKLETFTNTHMTTDTVHYGFYNSAGVLQSGTNLGSGIGVPQQDKYWYVQNSRERAGLTTKLEGRFSDSFYAFATLGYYRFRDTMERNELLIDPRNRGTVQNLTPTSGRYPAATIEVGYSVQKMTNATAMVQGGFDWTLPDDQLLSGRVSLSRATYREPISMVKFITGLTYNAPGVGTTITPLPSLGFSYDTSGLNASFDVDPAVFYNLNNYQGFYYRPNYKRSASNNVNSVKLDYSRHLGRDDQGFGFGAGVTYTESQVEYNVYRDEYTPNNTLTSPLTLASVTGQNGAPLMYSNGNLNLLTIDPQRAWAAFYSHAASEFTRTNQDTFSNQDNFDLTEKNAGLYGLVAYNADRLRTQFGLRYDSVDLDSAGRQRINGVWKDRKANSSYDFVLPSALISYDLTDRIDVRFGASQTIGRPSYDAYAARSAINFVASTDQGNPNATGVTVTLGNPDIKPRLSNNVDLAFNWKLNNRDGGLVSVALFNKDIQDEIFSSTSFGYTYEGVTYVNAAVSRPINATSASVRGVELAATMNSLEQLHPILRPVGFSTNWSVMEGSMDVLLANGTQRRLKGLVGQSNSIVNASVFYSHDGLELRAAYNKQGKALRSIVPDVFWQDMYWAPREQIDLQASYKVRNGVTVFAQASNIGHERMTSLTGPGKNLLKDTYSVPTIYWVGVRFTPSF